jgi:predicted MFS family arabinose efflux permease
MDRRNITITFSAAGLQVFFYSSAMIFFELFCWSKEFSVGEISVLLSIYHGLGLVSYYPFGILIDRFGRKRWLMLGLLCEGIGFLLLSSSSTFNSVLLSISILSVGLSAFMAAFRPYFADIIPEEARGKMIGLSDTLQLVAKTAAPTFGGFLFNLGAFIPFLVSGIGNTFLGFLSSFLKEEKKVKAVAKEEIGIKEKMLPLNTVGTLFYLLLIFSFFASFSFSGLGYIRLYLVTFKNFDSIVIGAFFSLITGTFALFSIISGTILDKTSRGVLLMLLGSLCRGIFMILIFFISSPVQLYLIVFIGIPYLFSNIWTRKELYRVVPVEYRGRLLSFHMIISDLSSTVAPLIYGLLWGIDPHLILLSGVSVILGGIILSVGYRFLRVS